MAQPEIIAAIRNGVMTLNEAIEQEYGEKKKALSLQDDERLKDLTAEQRETILEYTTEIMKNMDAVKDDAIEEVISEKNEEITIEVNAVKANVAKALNKKEQSEYFGVAKPRTTPEPDEFAEYVIMKDSLAHLRKLTKRYQEIIKTQDKLSIEMKRKAIQALVRISKDRLDWATSLNNGLEDVDKVDLNGHYSLEVPKRTRGVDDEGEDDLDENQDQDEEQDEPTGAPPPRTP